MHNNMKVYGEVYTSVWLHAFLTSGMGKVSNQFYVPTVLIPYEAKRKIIMSRSSISVILNQNVVLRFRLYQDFHNMEIKKIYLINTPTNAHIFI